LGITPLALLLEEATLLDETMLLLDEERTLEETTELEERTELDELDLIELELTAALETPQPPTMPNGAGWLLQVATEIQLLLFS
jgi:hypothetical protein